MKPSTKFWLAIFTFLPIVFLIVFFVFFFTVFLENAIALEHHPNEFPEEFIRSLVWFIPLIILMAITSLGIKIYYIVHTNNNTLNDTTKKIMWTLLLIFTGSVGAIVYYFIEIVPLKKVE